MLKSSEYREMSLELQTKQNKTQKKPHKNNLVLHLELLH